MNKLTVGIVGSRDLTNYKTFLKYLERVISPDEVARVVSGGAKGVDSLARKWAKENYLPLTEHLPDWKAYGKSAGFRRNGKIIADSDLVIAFHVNESKGTAHSIRLANEQQKPLVIFAFTGEPIRGKPGKLMLIYEGTTQIRR